MLAGMRTCFLLSFFLAFSVAVALPLQAQVNGVPPSVTSIGFGGRFVNGVQPSVTSLGPKGYGNSWPVSGNCCAFWPANPNGPLSSGRHHRHKDHGDSLIGVAEPVYIPYAPESDDDSPDTDADYVHAPGPPNHDAATQRSDEGDSTLQADASEPVDDQPPTVLVFKDGHQSDVLNYAIVGNTLFDLSAGRTRKILLADLDLPATRKANDDRGVDFQIPASAAPK
jgi:hypothetical protein